MPRKPVPAPVTAVQRLACAALQVDEGIQPRERLDAATIHAYAETYQEAEPGQEPFPPLEVFHVEGTYYVADGFHRLAAARQAGWDTIPCQVQEGSKRDAMVFACFANVRRGLRYQHGDWGRILERLLADPQVAQRGDRQLAAELGVSHVYVWKIRTRLQEEARLRDTLAQLPATATSPPARIQEQLAQYLEVPVASLKALAAQSNMGYGGSLQGSTTPRLLKDLARQTVEGKRSPQQVAHELAADITRLTTTAAPTIERPPRPSRAKADVAARQAEREREALAGELHGVLMHVGDVYPWTPWEEWEQDVEEEAEDGPKLQAKAQALVAAVLPKDAGSIDHHLHVARLVVTALDAAWQARLAGPEAEKLRPYL